MHHIWQEMFRDGIRQYPILKAEDRARCEKTLEPPDFFTDLNLDQVVDKADRIVLGVPFIHPQGSDTGSVINGGKLKSFNRFTSGIYELEEFYINLNMMPRHLFFIAVGCDSSFSRIAGQPIHSIMLEHVPDATA
jgi:hypothetical protein